MAPASQHVVERVFCGTLIHSTGENAMEILENKLIGISNNGKIVFIEDGIKDHRAIGAQFGFAPEDVVFLKHRQFLMPGLVDTHIHAPQYIFTGTGYDLPLLGWLDKYTFPTEASFKDVDFAKDAYRKCVERLLKNGTTTACYFATIHYEATKILCELVAQLGQRAYVGKVCMDTNAPEFYIETTQDSVDDTERFIKYVLDMKNPLVCPVVTPRFAIACSKTLMEELGKLAKRYQVPIQTHISENKTEVKFVKELFPESSSYADVYDKCGLLGDKTILSHCIHLSKDEVDVLKSRNTGVAHCPCSNFSLRSGVADVRMLLNKEIKVGLATDVSGGFSPSMLHAIRQCLSASNVQSILKTDREEDYSHLCHREAFYLATLGGSEVLGLQDRIGNFKVGKEFDALLIDLDCRDSPVDCFDRDSLEDIVQKFLYLGDDRNIQDVFVAGKRVAGSKQAFS